MELQRRQIEAEVDRLVRHAATLKITPDALGVLIDDAFSKFEAAPAEAAAESGSTGRER